MSEVISWPVTDDEKEACWEFVLSLKERGLDEARAIARAVELVEQGGKHTTEAMVRACRPRRKGPDTHTHDIGRSLKKHGVEDLEVDGRKEVLQQGEESAAADPEAELMKFGVEVLAMLFRKILPELPERMAKLKPRDGSLTLPPGGSFEAVRVDVDDGDEASDFVSVREPGMLLVKMNGRDVPVLRGAIRTFRAGGQVDRVILNATTRRLRMEENHGKYPRTRLYYTEWFPGKADWEFSFKQFITYAALFAPGAVNHARAATLARLLGETRAAMSARQVKVAEAYEAGGGRAKFQGMRPRKDPRRGTKLGPRNSTNH